MSEESVSLTLQMPTFMATPLIIVAQCLTSMSEILDFNLILNRFIDT